MRPPASSSSSSSLSVQRDLIFDPDSCASPAVQRGVKGPYMEKIATMPHYPHTDAELWRRTYSESYAIPDLSHTGARSSMEPSSPKFSRPDGTVSAEMRSQIQSMVRRFPVPEPKDVRSLDAKRSMQQIGKNSTVRANTVDIPMFSESCSSQRREIVDDQTHVSLADSLSLSPLSLSRASTYHNQRTGSSVGKRRAKQPYSVMSSVNAILEAEYG